VETLDDYKRQLEASSEKNKELEDVVARLRGQVSSTNSITIIIFSIIIHHYYHYHYRRRHYDLHFWPDLTLSCCTTGNHS